MLGSNQSVLAELRCARGLGISYKRFLGWEPTDGDSVEWDGTEREWMLALDSYETSHKCPVCGMDTEICHDEHAVRTLFAGAGVETCFVGAMREQAMQRFEKSGTVQNPGSQTTTMIPKTGG